MSGNNKEDLETPSSSTCQEDIFPGYNSVEDFTKDGFKCLMEGIKHANALPSGRDWNFYSTFDSFTSILSQESNHLMDGITSVLRKNEVGSNMRNQTSDKKTEILIDANDLILERVATNIDEMNGIKKTVSEPVVLQSVSAELPVNINGSWNRCISARFSVTKSLATEVFSQPSKASTSHNTIRLLTAENIVRPQKFFRDKIDNRNESPWEPRIKEKPNSLKPLAIFLEEIESRHEFSHPYEFELDRFTPPDDLLNKTKVTKPKLLKDTQLIEVNELSQLPKLIEDLRKYKAIAIDLEHHSYRSFMGITCLMQISTPETDYLVDTLALRNDLWILNEVFTKPDVTKIFHGADSDILWLQRDLSLYIVNLFDTHLAAKQLEYSGLSLAYLLKRFCSFIPNKQFQLADWRIRPLPYELKNYAREDTHYLIYIYQNMRNELIDKANGKSNLLKAVIDTSTTLCKKRYFKPRWHENSHLEFYSRCHRTFDNKQLFALKELYKWRDNIARLEDESTGYVLPNNMLLEIAGRLPKEMQGILACCRPVPPLVRANLLEIHKIILKALEKPFEQPILKEDTRGRGSTKKIAKINVDSPLNCPHDLTKNGEFRDDLPTLLNSNQKDNLTVILSAELDIEKNESLCSVFNIPRKHDIEIDNSASEKLRKFKESFNFLGPYERYKLVKPFIEAREKKLAEEKAKEEEEIAKKRAESQANMSVVRDSIHAENTAVGEDTRTDEERIESIREHFLQLARKSLPPNPSPPKKLSLVEMGGSKKRKRDESILRGSLHSDHNLPENEMHSPIPNLKITLHTNEDDSASKLTRKKRALDGDPHENLVDNRWHRQKQIQKIRPETSSSVEHKNQGTSTSNFGNRGSPRNKNRGKKSYRGKQKVQGDRTNNPAAEDGGSEDFSAYDYSMVDFRQFQGGAKAVEKSKQFKSKFRGRGKPNRRGGKNQNNKAMSFGRDRGR